MGVMLLWPALIPVAAAQQAAAAAARDVTQLGGSTAFYRRSPLTTVASLRRMAGEPGMAHDIGTALRQAGLPDLADNVIAVLSAADTSVMGGECSDATPLDGVIVECLVRPGQALQWMAYRPDGSGDEGSEEPGLLRNIRWAGRQPFRAFLFRTTENDRTYTFVIPKVCGNLSLMGVQEIPHIAVAVPPALFAPFTPAWMVHVGLPLTRNTRFPVHLLTEGRLFLDHADDIRNNYQFWGGVRVHF
jgi:hypothetical protein